MVNHGKPNNKHKLSPIEVDLEESPETNSGMMEHDPKNPELF